VNQLQPYQLLVVQEPNEKSIVSRRSLNAALCCSHSEFDEALERPDIDLIVLDESLSFSESVTLCRVARLHPRHAATPIVLISPNASSDMMTNAVEEGIDCVLLSFPPVSALEALARGKMRRMQVALQDTSERYESFKRHIVHGFSHEFRTPLTAVSVGAELLRERLLQAADPLISSLLETITRGSERLKHTVQEFVAIQQIVSGAALELSIRRKQVLPAYESMNEMTHTIRQSLAARGIDIPFNTNEPSFGHKGTIEACKSHLFEIASQLAFHAASVVHGEAKLSVENRMSERMCEINVRDFGERAHERWANVILPLFESLERRAKSEPGRGVELAVAAHLCEINGGSLSIYHAPDGGVTASVRFCVTPPQ
jgi:signal transduction histidine kinase